MLKSLLEMRSGSSALFDHAAKDFGVYGGDGDDGDEVLEDQEGPDVYFGLWGLVGEVHCPEVSVESHLVFGVSTQYRVEGERGRD